MLAHNDGVLVMIAKYNPQVHALNRGLGELTRGGQGAASFSFSIGPFLVEEKPAFIQSDPSEVMCNLFRKAWPHAAAGTADIQAAIHVTELTGDTEADAFWQGYLGSQLNEVAPPVSCGPLPWGSRILERWV